MTVFPFPGLFPARASWCPIIRRCRVSSRLCITGDGTFTWVQGVAAEYNAKAPSVPETVLALCSVKQTWREASARVVQNDGVRVVAFSDMEALAARVEYALQEVARQRLEADVATREAGARVGLFVTLCWTTPCATRASSRTRPSSTVF